MLPDSTRFGRDELGYIVGMAELKPRSKKRRETSAARVLPRKSPRPSRKEDAPEVEIPGVPRAVAGKLAQMGIVRAKDLVLHLPLRYEDETKITPIARAAVGTPVQIEAEVQSAETTYRPRRQTLVRIRDASGEAMLRFFNLYPNQARALEAGATIRAFGELRGGFFGGEMMHPRFRVVGADAPLPAALTPVYPTVSGLGQATLRRLIEAALAKEDLGETLPASLIEKYELASIKRSVHDLHFPRPGEDLDRYETRNHPAWRRIKFDELLAQQISMRKHYRERKARRATNFAPGGSRVGALLAALPYKLTSAQRRAWSEIEADLNRGHPMHRLLQGDVGSGKTVVAVLAALRAGEHGAQTAVMAPTEILAEQHYRKFTEWLAPLKVPVVWLTGSQSAKERAPALVAIASGEASVAIGTHALFQQGVEFKNMGLAIVDEQHRFGVAQRLALREKAGRGKRAELAAVSDVEPHVLMMSATPIPRTLSMSYYADLDISVIDEMPPGRKPVLTKLVSASRRGEVLSRIREACAAGGQAYWVCPLIEESETLDLQTAIDTHAALSAELREMRVGLLHGRMHPREKAEVMGEFSAGKIQLLVATTVIEVGVDVPNAALMVIEHAERFGLAQLHQLRGRVGRGAAQSACVLLYQNPLSEGARQRLKVIFENTDGFVVASEDLKQRGPGEFLGKRQSGVPLLRFADLTLDEEILNLAREAAEWLLENDPSAAECHLDRWLESRSRYMLA